MAGAGGLAFLAGTVAFNFAGVEAQSVHANELKDPKKGYPLVNYDCRRDFIWDFHSGRMAVAGILPYAQIVCKPVCLTPSRQLYQTDRLNLAGADT